jgi:hypothetical protein
MGVETMRVEVLALATLPKHPAVTAGIGTQHQETAL